MEQLASELMRSVQRGSARSDETLGPYAPLFGFLHSSVMKEGHLLELAIAEAAQATPDLELLPRRALPITPSALEMLSRTTAEAAKGVRFPAKVFSDKKYTPDLFLVDRAAHIGLLLDVKRNLANHRPQEVEELRLRMLAAASSAAERIAESRGPVLVDVDIAIIDGADLMSDHERRVFRLSEIDHLLETQGVAEFIARTRALFAEKVQAELHRRWGELLQSEGFGPALKVVAPFAPEARSGPREDMQTRALHGGADAPHFGYARRPRFH